MARTLVPRPRGMARALVPLAAALFVAAAVALRHFSVGVAAPVDAEAELPRAAHGTRFSFEVIESRDAAYLGDTPSHAGKDGGLTVRPQVALGDPVHRREADGRDTLVGRITHVEWNRVSGSLAVEFDPEPFQRIAVGDEVWIDLNPRPQAPAGGAGR